MDYTYNFELGMCTAVIHKNKHNYKLKRGGGYRHCCIIWVDDSYTATTAMTINITTTMPTHLAYFNHTEEFKHSHKHNPKMQLVRRGSSAICSTITIAMPRSTPGLNGIVVSALSSRHGNNNHNRLLENIGHGFETIFTVK